MFGFGTALSLLESGAKVSRQGWNGKGMWLKLVRSGEYTLGPRVLAEMGVAGQLPWIGMRTADAMFVPWLASQTDMQARDWGIVGEGESWVPSRAVVPGPLDSGNGLVTDAALQVGPAH